MPLGVCLPIMTSRMDCEQKLVMSLCACSVIYMAGAMLDVLHVILFCHVTGMMDCENYIVYAMDCEAVLHVWYVHCSPAPYISFISNASEI